MSEASVEQSPGGFMRHSGLTLGQLAGVTLQLGLLLWMAWVYRIEQDGGFLHLAPLILVGFVVHALLPQRLRLPFFVLLSVASVGVIVGLKQGAGLIGLGLGLIALCHLPIAFRLRVALVLLAGVALALVRGQWVAAPGWDLLPTLVLPVLASMFMFRLMVYLYDLRTEKTPASWWERLAYFFMIPNVCFPLFPVVDYQTFRRTHYKGQPYAIYRKGLFWVFRGLTHLLAYRVVYYYLVLSPTEVASPGTLVRYVVSTYLLYLRVSGSFHLIVGVLGLFGFDLPRTNQLYLLAGGFNDYWRRINIYWKDFMLKMFFRPSYMALKGLGGMPALILASVVVFVATWLLHSYQWFWLRGSFPITGPDIVFWGTLGACMVLNTVWDARRGTPRSLSKAKFRLGPAFGRSLRTVGMLVLVCAMWSLWTSPTLADYGVLVRSGFSGPASQWGLVLAGLAGLVLLGVAGQFADSRNWGFPAKLNNERRLALACAVTPVLMIALGTPVVYLKLDDTKAAFILALQQTGFNRVDRNLMDRGYYEALLGGSHFTSALWRVEQQKPKDWVPVPETDLVRHREDILQYELIPSIDKEWKRVRVRVNSQGLRDLEYEREKPPGTYRIALIGASYTFGTGVENEEVFEALVEEWLNRDDPSENHERYEILNFSVPGYSVLQNLFLLNETILDYDPDLLLYTFHATENNRLRLNLVATFRNERPIPYRFVQQAINETGVEIEMESMEIGNLLAPRFTSIIAEGFRAIADTCRDNGVRALAVYVPILPEILEPSETREPYTEAARDAGFVTLQLQDVYGPYSEESLRIAPWDIHPNATGHRLIAEHLYEALRQEGVP